jgi:hypothetical protein
MQKWQYGRARYKNGLLEGEGEEMADISVARKDLGPFLEAPGEEGWELCGSFPNPGTSGSWTVIFKRPV